MKIREIIEYKINLLIDIMLTKGVSPSDLANNIFLDEYTEITFCKNGENVIGELTFRKAGENTIKKMEYVYDSSMKVQEIKECVNNVWTSLWDRSMREQEIINEILDLMQTSYSKSQIENFIGTLPLEIRSRFIDSYKKIA